MKDPTAEEQEEGLMKYHPLLPMIPTNVLSYNQTIARLQGIRAAPAGRPSPHLISDRRHHTHTY